MARRELPEINAGSMADIAFLLLIFFLVTTTMDTDGGLTRKLPPMPEEQLEDLPEVKQRNVFEVLVNANDQLLVEGQLMLVSELREAAKEFIVSNPAREDLPEFKLTDIELMGKDYPVSKQIISLQNDRGTSYEMYIKVQNELVAAYNDLRDELGNTKFGANFDDLTEEQRDAIKEVYPQRISEAEPKSIGN
ncbi:MAG TPA: biopolymer transporter ExbD [Flavobacteriales bacterium]|nr:biopolymer transporter ExbD [Flavobacteriales bacterium]